MQNKIVCNQDPCSLLSAAPDLFSVFGYNPPLLSLQSYSREKGGNWHETLVQMQFFWP